MADLTDVIAGAVADAGIGESADAGTPDTGNEPAIEPDNSSTETAETFEAEGVSDGANPDNVEDKSAEGTVVNDKDKPAADGTPVVKEPAKDQITKDLEELGLKAPKEGERENKIPYSRTRKIAENYGKKVEARFTGEITTLKGENEKLTNRQKNFERADGLAANDPDRYMKLLSAIHPGKYDKFLNPPAPAKESAKPAPAADVVAKLGAEPQPDVEFEDKSRGYSPEQHKKLLQWNRGVAKAEAKAEALAEMEERMEAKYGKIAKDYDAREAYNEDVAKVKETTTRVYEVWGKDFVDKHEPEIVAYMEAHKDLTTAECVSAVLLPKVRADRNTMRTDLIKETKTRTAAAAKTVPSVSTTKDEDTGPKSLEDVIRQSVATLRR